MQNRELRGLELARLGQAADEAEDKLLEVVQDRVHRRHEHQ